MTPPTYSKPKQKLCPSEVQNRRDYRTVFTTRRPLREPVSAKPAGFDPIQSMDQMRTDWIDCKSDRDEVAAILKGGRA